MKNFFKPKFRIVPWMSPGSTRMWTLKVIQKITVK